MDTHTNDETIERWRKSYQRDFSSVLREIDDWLSRYRKDFMPDTYGRVSKNAKSVQRSINVPVRNFEYVGHGGVTNPNKCQKFIGWGGCLNRAKHKDDLIWAYKILNSCDSPKCSRCYRSWASRLAHSVEPRLVAGSKVHGDIEHIIASLRKEDRDLSYKQMKDKCIRNLKSSSFHSGYILLHSKSFGKFRPHFHVLAYVGAEGGAERCRQCGGGHCFSCDGVYGRIYRSDAESGWILKILPKRITVGGTLFYEAEHCTIDYSKRRFRVGVWYGSVSYSTYCNLGVKVERGGARCPECGNFSGPIEYLGEREFVTDKDLRDFHKASFEPYMEGDKVVWVVKEKFEPSRKGEDFGG